MTVSCLIVVVLTRNDGRIAVDEIDDLQMDLETLLIAAVGRLRKLQAEVNILSDVGEGKKDKKVCFYTCLNLFQ